MATVLLRGRLLGRVQGARAGGGRGWIVHAAPSDDAAHPAENAFVYVEAATSGARPRARYVTWINLYDIEHAARVEGKRWQLVEPARPFRRLVEWHPYGWGGRTLPSVADLPGA